MSRRKSNASNAGTFLALLAFLVLAGGFVGLTAMVMPAAAGFVAVVFGIFLFGAMHYLLWGWWLGRSGSEEDAGEED